jgi:DNA invertase Pin-like site-specific DNA recombinase
VAADLLTVSTAPTPALLLSSEKISASQRSRDAYVYVRQSTPSQVVAHTESLVRQYELRERAVALGWPAPQVVVIDTDLGRSGADATARLGFRELVADVGLGQVGIVLGIEVSRLARNNADWYQLLDLCALTDTLIADADGVYHPGDFNDRLVLGLKGTMSEALCRHRHRASYADPAVMPTGREEPVVVNVPRCRCSA